MVTVITEKLRNQSLDDLKTEYVQQLPGISWSSPSPQPSAFHLTDKWTLFVDNNVNLQNPSDPESAAKTTRTSHSTSSLESSLSAVALYQRTKCLANLSCKVGATAPNTPPVPPKKRHCRSLSIPGDGSHCRKYNSSGSCLVRPVAVKPHLNNNKLMKSRNSPLGLHHRSCTSPLHRNLCTSPLQRGTSCVSPGLNNGSIGSGSGVWKAIGNDYFQTPPESPVPRPASVSSGYYDSSLSYLNAPWLDHGQPQAHTQNLLRHSWDCSTRSINTFKSRSLSMEEHVSDSGRSSASTQTSLHTVSMCAETAGSMPAMPGSTRSTPASPQRPHRPRCRSQPCFNHDRRFGVKRRRDEERPSLNFIKMTETAYRKKNEEAVTSGISIPHSKNVKSPRNLTCMFSEKAHQLSGLMPIASSPLDTNLPSAFVLPSCESPSKHLVQSEAVQKELTDSGCSDTNETLSLVDTDDGCLCDSNSGDAEEEFMREVSNDLDLEQIEKD